MTTFANAAAHLRNNGSFYSDPIMCAVADGNYNAQHNTAVTPAEYRGIVIDNGYFCSDAIRIGYLTGWKQGTKIAAKRQKRGW